MKKITIIAAAIIGMMTSCIDHPEAAKRALSLKKRAVKSIDSSTIITCRLDTIFKIGDTTIYDNQKVVIIR